MSLNPQLGSAPITAGPLTVVDRANISLPYASGGGGGSAVSTFATASISSLTVSSINGVAPGGSLFQSTFSAVPCPGNTSTILCELPAGQFAYQGLIAGGGATSMLSGNVNVIKDLNNNFNWGQISQIVGSQPAGSFPSQMVINQGDSGLSTIKLIVAATGGTSGAFTGVVSKLY